MICVHVRTCTMYTTQTQVDYDYDADTEEGFFGYINTQLDLKWIWTP